MRPGGDLERAGRVEAVGRVGGPDGGDDDVVDEDVEVLIAAVLDVAGCAAWKVSR